MAVVRQRRSSRASRIFGLPVRPSDHSPPRTARQNCSFAITIRNAAVLLLLSLIMSTWSFLGFFISFVVGGCSVNVDGFVSSSLNNQRVHHYHQLDQPSARIARSFSVDREEDLETTFRDNDDEEEDDEPPAPAWTKNARWNSLSPKVKLRIIQEAQAQAIANKKKREPAKDKKRKMMQFVQQAQSKKKQQSRVRRPLPFGQRTPLAELVPGATLTGTVISLARYGAYVDVGTECDGLLHVSQISHDIFVQHPRQVLRPGEEVQVRVSSLNPDLKKLHLTMLPEDVVRQAMNDADDDDDDEERIELEEIQVDDELWGEIKRVTDYGAYVELGAIVDGFLHFMDHPEFGATPGAPPRDFMERGDRIRVWVTNVDLDKTRIKLTANRPTHLPGPRRDVY